MVGRNVVGQGQSFGVEYPHFRAELVEQPRRLERQEASTPSNFWSSPFWNISVAMSHPPTS